MPAKRGGSSGYTRSRSSQSGTKVKASSLKPFNTRGVSESTLKTANQVRNRAVRAINSSGIDFGTSVKQKLESHGAKWYEKNKGLSDVNLVGKVMGYI